MFSEVVGQDFLVPCFLAAYHLNTSNVGEAWSPHQGKGQVNDTAVSELCPPLPGQAPGYPLPLARPNRLLSPTSY